MRGADDLAITTFTKACDAEARNGDAAFRETLDRLEGPVLRNLKVQSEAGLTVVVVPYEGLLQGKVSPLEAELLLLRPRLGLLSGRGGSRRA